MKETYCYDCSHFDEFNKTCWAVYGRFGEELTGYDPWCEWYEERHKKLYPGEMTNEKGMQIL